MASQAYSQKPVSFHLLWDICFVLEFNPMSIHGIATQFSKSYRAACKMMERAKKIFRDLGISYSEISDNENKFREYIVVVNDPNWRDKLLVAEGKDL